MGERQFGPYRLVKELAVGGMAEIHLAKTSGVAGFEKYVALKMIHSNYSQDEQFVQMLIDEAKITVQLQHANIAQTFDLGRVGDTFYLTMEYVDGIDLFSLLRQGAEIEQKMPVDVAAHICRCVANGLDYAHRKRDVSGKPLGIVHRDVSPQNVLLSNAGEIKLVDFGIAKASHRARQTEAGVIKGKYYYMSPEQALAETVDHRSDIFSAGILLHEMITGQMLYLEDDLQTLLDRVRRADIPLPSSVRTDLPPRLEQIAMRALARDPDDRFQSAGALSAELDAFLQSHSPVFTAAKVSQYIRQVAGAEAAPAPPPEPDPPKREDDDGDAGAGRVTQEQLLREPSELRDENSVIFRVEDLVGAAGQGAPSAQGGAGRPAEPRGRERNDEVTRAAGDPGFARGADMSTRLIDGPGAAGGETGAAPNFGDDEQTVISGPPQFSPEDAAGNSAPPPAPSSPAATNPPGRQASAPPDHRGDLPLAAPEDSRVRPPSAPDANASQARAPSAPEGTPEPAASGQPPAGAHGASAAEADADPTSSPPPPNRSQTPFPDAAFGGSESPREPYAPGAAGEGAPEAAFASPPAPAAEPPPATPAPEPPGFDPRTPIGPPEPSEPPSLAPASIRSPAVIAGIAIVALAIVGAAVWALLFGDEDVRERALDIDSEPPGARVTIDGAELEETTPVSFENARPGESHEIALEAPGYEKRRFEQEVPEGGTSPIPIFRNLEPRTVELRVDSDPEGAEVRLNGDVAGETPFSGEVSAPEATRLELGLSGYEGVERELDWRGERSKELAFTLEDE